ncbi:hypothetical protein tb265_06140 [Gemmatimonadetes bacterium T265]|nr:hypothetical protein tb265_06140 [Gemmatimonadetes bacterium T265]
MSSVVPAATRVLPERARAAVRTTAARVRRDVNATAVHAGLRAAAGTAAPLALAYTTGAHALVVAALGGWLTAIADVGGATRTRVRVMGASVVLDGLAYAAGARAAALPAGPLGHGPGTLAVAALVFCWAAAGGLLRVLGDAGATLGTLMAVTFCAGLAGPQPHVADALRGGAIVAGGGLWTMFLALAVWPVRPYGAARRVVGDAYHALATFARGIAAAADAVGGAEAGADVAARYTALARAEHPRVRAALEAGRTVLVATRRSRLGASPRGDDLAILLDGTDLVFVTLLTTAEAMEQAGAARARDGAAPGDVLGATLGDTLGAAAAAAGRPDDVAALRALVVAAAGALDDVAAAIVPGPRAGRRPASLDALERDVVVAAARLERPHATGRAAPTAAPLAALRHAAALVAQLVGEIDRAASLAASLASGGEDTLLAAARAGWRSVVARATTDRPRRPSPARGIAGVLAGVDSPTVRHALRLGTATALAQVLGATLHIARGPWLTTTTLIVLQPSAGLTLRRSAARVGGTVAGGVIAALLAAALRDPRLIAAVVFPLAAAAVALRAVHYGVFVFFLTPVFVLIAQPAPGNWGLAAVRAADTALGGVVAVVASLLFWPTWEAASMPGTLAAAVEAARAHAALAVRRAAAPEAQEAADPPVPPPAAVAAARRRAGLAATAAEEAFGRLMAEPGGRGARAEAIIALLARVRRVNSAATALATLGPAPGAAASARLEAFGADVDAVLGDAAAALRAGRAPAALPAALARALGDAPAADDGPLLETVERRAPDLPAWGALVRVARHALGVRAAVVRFDAAPTPRRSRAAAA